MTKIIKQKDLYPNSTSNSPVIGGSGVYKNTIKIDVTECKSVEESTNKVLEHCKIESKV